MPELREVFEMTTKQMEPDVDAWRQQEGRQRRSTRNRRIGALAAVAAIGVATIAVIVGTRGGRDVTTPADEPATVSPVIPTAVEVATGFLEAYGAFDTEQAITYLADDADLSGIGVAGTGEFRSMVRLLEAIGYEQMLDPCVETASSASGTDVRCAFDFHAIRSDEIGRGPYSGSDFILTIRDGEIVRATLYWEIGEFSPEMWEPFALWVSETYPEDGAVMYNSDYTDWQLTQESIRLWKRHSREYVNVVAS